MFDEVQLVEVIQQTSGGTQVIGGQLGDVVGERGRHDVDGHAGMGQQAERGEQKGLLVFQQPVAVLEDPLDGLRACSQLVNAVIGIGEFAQVLAHAELWALPDTCGGDSHRDGQATAH